MLYRLLRVAQTWESMPQNLVYNKVMLVDVS